jgi:hypothetical protein
LDRILRRNPLKLRPALIGETIARQLGQSPPAQRLNALGEPADPVSCRHRIGMLLPVGRAGPRSVRIQGKQTQDLWSFIGPPFEIARVQGASVDQEAEKRIG